MLSQLSVFYFLPDARSIPKYHHSRLSIQSPQNLRMAEGDLSQEDVCGYYARNSDYLHMHLMLIRLEIRGKANVKQ